MVFHQRETPWLSSEKWNFGLPISVGSRSFLWLPTKRVLNLNQVRLGPPQTRLRLVGESLCLLPLRGLRAPIEVRTHGFLRLIGTRESDSDYVGRNQLSISPRLVTAILPEGALHYKLSSLRDLGLHEHRLHEQPSLPEKREESESLEEGRPLWRQVRKPRKGS